MPTLSITKSYDDGTALTESQLDDAFGSVSTFINTTKLDADNLQDGAVTAAKLGASAVTATKIDSDAVTTAKILDLNVTAGKLAADSVVTAKILDLNVTTGKINDLAVTTGKLANNAVTFAKMVASNISQSSGITVTVSDTTTPTDVTGLSCAITTTGRDVRLSLMTSNTSSDTTQGGYVAVGKGDIGTDQSIGLILFLRDSTVIGKYTLSLTAGASVSLSGDHSIIVPASSFSCEDISLAAGTYTYKVQAYTQSTTDTPYVQFASVKLVAREIL